MAEIPPVTWKFTVPLGRDAQTDLKILQFALGEECYSRLDYEDYVYYDQDMTECTASPVLNARTERVAMVFTFSSSKGWTLPPEWLQKLRCTRYEIIVEAIEEGEKEFFDSTSFEECIIGSSDLSAHNGHLSARSYVALERKFLRLILAMAERECLRTQTRWSTGKPLVP